MIGGQVGPYRIETELGTGGMGTVYLAEVSEQTPVLEAGARVALKIVHPHLLATPGFFKRFLQEADVGKRIHHANVVRTYEVDATLYQDKQVNYMAMEYVEGRSLRRLVNDLGTVPETLLREIAMQIAAGLEAVHNAGIVHRDLKPENVLITDDQKVRIMDLGVAKLQEASIALTKEGQFTGSLLYASPEQCEARDVAAPADLYALGVMLYELATGTNPFRRDDPVAIIKAHISLEPQRASDLNPDISLYFTEVVATLIAKSPAERFSSAQQLYQVLEEGEESEWWAEREKHLHTVIAELPSISVRRDTELHGRTHEMAFLTEAWNRAKEGQGNTVLLEGEAGLGKTRLVDAFMRSLAGQDAHVMYGSYPPTGGMGGISDAVMGKFGGSSLQESLALYLTVTPSLIPAFAALVRHESPPTGIEPLQGEALHAVCCHLMRALAAEAPTLWILDDLHFAPAESRRIMLAMSRALAPHRVLLVMTSRPGLPEDELAHFSRLEHFSKRTLERLGARQVIELLQDLFKSEALAEKLGGKIAYKSDGVPFFVIELVRGLRDGALLKQLPNGSYIQTQQITDIQVPSAVKDLIAGRLRELSKEERGILDVGAVQGYEFDPDLVARVREIKRVQVLETLADLERTRGIVRGVGRKYRFDQNQIHEVVLADVSEALVEEYHTMIAEAFVKREGITPETAAGEGAYFVARHHLHGSEPREGLSFLQPALDYLQGVSRTGMLVDLGMSALPHQQGRDRVELLLRLASALGQLGRTEEQKALIDEALPAAEQESDLALLSRTFSALSAYCNNTSQHEEGYASSKRAAELAQEAGDTFLEATARNGVGLPCWYLGRYDEARETWERAIELARESGNVPIESIATGNVGYVFMATGRYAAARDAFVEGLRIRTETDNKSQQANSEESLGILMSGLGDYDAARGHHERCVELAREIGSSIEEGHGLNGLGNVARCRSEFEEAKRQYGFALNVRREMGFLGGVAESLTGLGALEMEHSRIEPAIGHLDEALLLAEKTKQRGTQILAAARRALLPGGNASLAKRLVEAFENNVELRQRMEARFLLWKATGEAVHLDRAREMLRHLRDHAPEEYRDSMVANVPLHKQIMEAQA